MSPVKRITLLSGLFFLVCSGLFAVDEMTQYELLAPDTYQFAIRYDVSATIPGSTVYFNIIRPGSEASNERAFDRSTGKDLEFVLTNGKEAKSAGQAEADTADETGFIKIKLPHPVPQQGEFRLRIFKTYKDSKSYFGEGSRIVFERNLGVKRNVIIFPQRYEIIFSSVPVIVSLEPDGRMKVSMVNDREDELEVRIEARKLPEKEKK